MQEHLTSVAYVTFPVTLIYNVYYLQRPIGQQRLMPLVSILIILSFLILLFINQCLWSSGTSYTVKASEPCVGTKIAFLFSLSQCMPEVSGPAHHCLFDMNFHVAWQVGVFNIYCVEKCVTGLQCMAQHQRWSLLLVAVAVVMTFSWLTMHKACSNDVAFFLSVTQCFIAFCNSC